MQDLRRYYDKDNKKFFYAGWHYDENGHAYYKSIPDFALREKNMGDAFVMRLDKNRNKIFEGDIVRYPEYLSGDYMQKSEIEEVIIDEFGVNDNIANLGYMNYPENCEIVGNKYVGYFKNGDIY